MSKNSSQRAFALFLGLVACVLAADKPATDRAGVTTALTPESGRLVVDVRGLPPPVPVFFSATVDQTVRLSQDEIVGTMRLKLHVVQGRPETLTLGLAGDGEILDVSGKDLRDWSVRQGEGGRRFLDLRAALSTAPDGKPTPLDFDLTVHTRLIKPTQRGTPAVLLITPGHAVGFASKIILQPDPTVDLRVTSATGLTPLDDKLQFFSTGEARLDVKIIQRGAAPLEAELIGAQLAGKVDEAGGSVEFRLRGQLSAQKPGARMRLLAGRAALSDVAAGDGWHVELVALSEQNFGCDLVADRAGLLPFELTFAAEVRESGEWRSLDFTMPAGGVVPLRLEGLGDGVMFKPDSPVVPTATPQGGHGFLPADGVASLAWKRTREATAGALAFTSTELAEVRVGAGLLRQTSQISFRILQGKLGGVRVRLDGPGEIVGVEGANVVGWNVLPVDSGRVLDVRFSRPMETQGALVIQSQTEPGNPPGRAMPLRLLPEGGVRHSGFLRVTNHGAVRVEVAEIAGMMQLAPAGFPGPVPAAEARQVFVYRFPSSNYGYRLIATQIQPEVAVSAITIHELAETARVLHASVELDVREAPLRDWTLRIPADYTVVAVNGSDVSDYVAETGVANGTRALRILFGRAIEGRQLLQLRLEKNQAAAAGDWTLPALQFSGAKSVRGHVGVVAAPGYRVLPVRVDRLVEVPLSFFPQQTPGLQQAWRLREPDWLAEVRIEALGQSVQADVFHLHALREGVVTTSVLINYFVVGAPANEWRIEVPVAAGNIDVVGLNVRRDWRREGDQVIVSLHQPVLGAATLLVTFEQPMSARGGTILPGQVRPLGVQAERGFIQVVSPLQVKHEIRRADGGLLKLEAAELPAEFRLFTTSPSLAVYHYTARPFNLELGVEWYAPGEMVDQVVDFAKLSSQVSRDGQVVTEAKFFVKTRGRQALRVDLPPGVKLWETRVDGAVVNARADGGQTIVPLPAKLNPNDPVVVTLRFGQAMPAGNSTVRLVAPRATAAPTAISEWVVRGDTGRVLVPRGGNAALLQPVPTETGFEWISRRGGFGALACLSLAGLGALLLRSAAGWRIPLGLLAYALATAGAMMLTGTALVERRAGLPELTFAATMVPPGETVSLELANVPEWRAMIVEWGVGAALVGGALLLVGWRVLRGVRERVVMHPLAYARSYGSMIAGIVLLALGLLAQRNGAVLFFAAVSATVFLRMLVPGVILWRRERRETVPPPSPEAGGGAVTAASLIACASLLGFAPGSGTDVRAAGSAGVPSAVLRSAGESPALFNKPAQALVQTWLIRSDRLFAEAELTVRGTPGDSFLLLRPPAVLTDFKGDGLRLAKVERDGQTAYYVIPEREGTLLARVRFEMPVPDRTTALALPTGPAATQRVTIELDQAGWEFASPMAVRVLPTSGLGENRSGATLVFAPHLAPVIQLRPKRRDLAAEATQFFAEVANGFVPGPGVVNGFSRVVVRPVQGRVAAIEIDVPPGLTVGEVSGGPVGAWRFDPLKRRLSVAIEPAQTGEFKFEVETQLGAGELPFALVLSPLRVVAAAGEIGTVALAFGGDAQPEGLSAVGLTAVSIQDFDATLLPRARDGQPAATVQNVWRYGPAGRRVELTVAPVAPEVRVTSRQVLSLDDDRLLMAINLKVAITRVGLFQLSFALPEGLEVEALSGPALNHWTEGREGAQRLVTLHLNGRTIGEQTFNVALAGAAPRGQDAWPLPRFLVREATRQTGEALLVPGKGIRLRGAARERVTQLDPRTVGGMQPGTLAFRLLQPDWVLSVGIETLEAWVTVQALQEVTLREGQTLTRLGLRYRVENAAVKRVQVRLPGLGEERARTVRATGPAVSDLVRVADTADLWEIRFQRGIVGETDVQLEFQGAAARSAGQPGGAEAIAPPEFVGARQTVQFVAIRSGGRLEIAAAALPRGWTRSDWSAVPAVLQNRGDRSLPALCFRVAEPEGALTVNVRRHDVAEALKLRVTRGDLLTLFAPTGAALTAVELKVDVLEKSTLRVRLPAGARLFSTLVNGESVAAVREGDAWLFHVSPHTAGDRAAAVRLVYATTTAANGPVALVGPGLSVPLENVTWRVVIPPGYTLDDYSGALRLRDERSGGGFGIDQYVSLVSSKRSADTQEAMSMLQQAGSWMQKGEQDKAAEALSRVSNGNLLDQAANEDARVQLRNLKTQQAVLGLNTRRQRLYFDNRADAAQNAPLEQAATLNPFMQGKLNFDPRQADQLLLGNTAEENTALRGIATRIVEQQLAADPAPGAIEVTLPERGHVLTFARSLQVDGRAPLELKLDVEKITRTNIFLSAILLIALGIIAAVELSRRPAEQG
ncbi:MAG: hypothetical protein EXS37_08530 [Opitutus sp.]|nr:hypothetical protein [Opitutus sp.]